MLPTIRFSTRGRKTRKPQTAVEARASKRASSSSSPQQLLREDTIGQRQERLAFSSSSSSTPPAPHATADSETMDFHTPRSTSGRAFFNDPSSEQFASASSSPPVDAREMLNLMRTFETRLWEMDVQIDNISCVCFGNNHAGLPYSRMSNRYHELVSRLSQVRIAVMEQKQAGDYMPGVTLLVEPVDHDLINLAIVKVATPRDLSREIFDEPISNEELETVILFVCSFSQWCGRSWTLSWWQAK